MAENLPKKLYITKLRQQEEEAKNWIIPSPLTSEGEEQSGSSVSSPDMGRTLRSPSTPSSLDFDIPSVSSEHAEPWDRLVESYDGISNYNKEKGGKPFGRKGETAFKVPGKGNIVGKVFKTPSSPAYCESHGKGKSEERSCSPHDSPTHQPMGSSHRDYRAVGGKCAEKFESYLRLQSKGLLENPFDKPAVRDSNSPSPCQEQKYINDDDAGDCINSDPFSSILPSTCKSKHPQSSAVRSPKSPRNPTLSKDISASSAKETLPKSPNTCKWTSPAPVSRNNSPASVCSFSSDLRSAWMKDIVPDSPLNAVMSPSVLLNNASPLFFAGYAEEDVYKHTSPGVTELPRGRSENSLHRTPASADRSESYHREVSQTAINYICDDKYSVSMSGKNDGDEVHYVPLKFATRDNTNVKDQFPVKQEKECEKQRCHVVQQLCSTDSQLNRVSSSQTMQTDGYRLSGVRGPDPRRMSQDTHREPLDFSTKRLSGHDGNTAGYHDVEFALSSLENLLAFRSSNLQVLNSPTDRRVQVQTHELLQNSWRQDFLWAHASHQVKQLTEEQARQMVPMPPSPVDTSNLWQAWSQYDSQDARARTPGLFVSKSPVMPSECSGLQMGGSFNPLAGSRVWDQRVHAHSRNHQTNSTSPGAQSHTKITEHRYKTTQMISAHSLSPRSNFSPGDLSKQENKNGGTDRMMTDTSPQLCVNSPNTASPGKKTEDDKMIPKQENEVNSTDDLCEAVVHGRGLPPCQVCGDTSVGYHCGAHICEACKKFYLRCMKNNSGASFKCLKKRSCKITKESRSQCQSCRYQKCHDLGMYLPGTEKARELRVDFKSIPCRVCGACSSGYHFGAITCEGCKGFFRRMAREKTEKDYQCLHGGNCDINTATRTLCRHCRYRKCLLIGMTLQGSRMGRQSNSRKRATVLELKRGDLPVVASQADVVKTEPSTEDSCCFSQSKQGSSLAKTEPETMSTLACAHIAQSVTKRTSPNSLPAGADVTQNTAVNLPEYTSHMNYLQYPPLQGPPYVPCSSTSPHLYSSFAETHQRNKTAFNPATPPGFHQYPGHPPIRMPCPRNMQNYHQGLEPTWKFENTAQHLPPFHHRVSSIDSSMPVVSGIRDSLPERDDFQVEQVSHPYPIWYSQKSPSQGHQNDYPRQTAHVEDCRPIIQSKDESLVNGMKWQCQPQIAQVLKPSQRDVSTHATSQNYSHKSDVSRIRITLPNSKTQVSSISSVVQSQKPCRWNLIKIAQTVAPDSCVLPGSKRSLPQESASDSDLNSDSCVSDSEDDNPSVEEYKNLAAQIVDCLEILHDLNLRPPQLDRCILDPHNLTSIWCLPTIAFQYYTKVIIRFCHYLPGFKALGSKDCMTLLRSALYPITLLHHAQKYDLKTGEYQFFINTATEKEVMMQYFPHFRPMETHFQETGHAIKSLNLTKEEYALLLMLTIYSADELSRAPLNDSALVCKFQDQAMAGLEYFCSHHKDPNRFGMLLLRLSELQRANDEHAQAIIQAQKDFPQVNFGDIWNEVVLWKPLGRNQ